MSSKKVKISMRGEISGLALIPLITLTVVISLYAMGSMKDSMESEALSGLKDVCYSVDAAYQAINHGEYRLEGETLYKGEYNITEDEVLIDNFVKNSDVELTLFFDDTRRATSLVDSATNKKILGTKASQEVTNRVVKGGEEFSSTSLKINDQNYYAYYIPMKNPDGKVVGMFFAGKPSENVNSMINKKTLGTLGISIALLILAAVVVLFISNRLGKAVRKTEVMLNSIAQGDLSLNVDQKLLGRGDEIGAMGKSLQELIDELKRIISGMKESADVLVKSGNDVNELADQTTSTADDISHAVEDVSQGAVSQAEDIESATMNVSEMGEAIGKIVSQVEILNRTSEDMEQAKTDADVIIAELSESSRETVEAVKRIEQQVKLTDESVTKIEDAVSLISSIAEETSLLSLNASIEAARAGEAGKGFAVVATQIQKLSEESNSSATSIAEVISNLAKESKNTVDAMNQMNDIINAQQEKLQQTREKFDGVGEGIRTSRNEVRVIKSDGERCDMARTQVTDVIQNLSSVSEENAAATQETMASMQELHATMEVLAGKAEDLKKLAYNLESDMQFFKM